MKKVVVVKKKNSSDTKNKLDNDKNKSKKNIIDTKTKDNKENLEKDRNNEDAWKALSTKNDNSNKDDKQNDKVDNGNMPLSNNEEKKSFKDSIMSLFKKKANNESVNTNQLLIKNDDQTSFVSNDKKPVLTVVKERILSVDRFRGFCIFFFVLSVLLPLFTSFDFLGPFVEHFPRNPTPEEIEGILQVIPGVSFSDLFAPMFIFAIGLSVVGSFRSKEKKYGTGIAYLLLTIRFLALIGLGYILNGFENGWRSILTKEMDDDKLITFDSLSKQMKIYAASFWIAIGLIIPTAISPFLKKYKKVHLVTSNILKVFLAIVGLMGVYFIFVATGEGFLEHHQTPIQNPEIYGSWEWDTLQNIGLAGLYALPFITLNKWFKLGVVIFAMAAITTLYENGFSVFPKKVVEGGVFGAIQWAAILLMGSIFFEIRDNKSFWIISSLLMFFSVMFVVGFKFGAYKRGASPLYAMFSASVSAVIFGIFHAFNNWKPKYDFFADWGSNLIIIYLATWLFIGALMGGLAEEKLRALPKYAGWLIAPSFIIAYSAFNWIMRRKHIHLRI